MRALLESEVLAVNGAHGDSWVMTILGFPHVIMGLIEMYNYVREWQTNGCEIDPDDDNYFKQDVCGLIS